MKYLRIAAMLGFCLVCASFASAQRVAVGVGVGFGPGYYGPAYYGPPPVCAYGYYGSYPYACAPYGYYGPDWFVGGVFIGAGPWFHGYHGRGFIGPRFGRGFDRPGFAGHGFAGHGFDRPGRGGFAHGSGGGGFARGGGGFHGGFHGGGHR